jgi:hypothetical protein
MALLKQLQILDGRPNESATGAGFNRQNAVIWCLLRGAKPKLGSLKISPLAGPWLLLKLLDTTR